MAVLDDNPDVDMVRFLKANGWEQLWHVDNWIRSEWRNDARISIDHAGRQTEDAYEVAMDRHLRQRITEDKHGLPK